LHVQQAWLLDLHELCQEAGDIAIVGGARLTQGDANLDGTADYADLEQGGRAGDFGSQTADAADAATGKSALRTAVSPGKATVLLLALRSWGLDGETMDDPTRDLSDLGRKIDYFPEVLRHPLATMGAALRGPTENENNAGEKKPAGASTQGGLNATQLRLPSHLALVLGADKFSSGGSNATLEHWRTAMRTHDIPLHRRVHNAVASSSAPRGGTDGFTEKIPSTMLTAVREAMAVWGAQHTQPLSSQRALDSFSVRGGRAGDSGSESANSAVAAAAVSRLMVGPICLSFVLSFVLSFFLSCPLSFFRSFFLAFVRRDLSKRSYTKSDQHH
jgi:hypothetical protein